MSNGARRLRLLVYFLTCFVSGAVVARAWPLVVDPFQEVSGLPLALLGVAGVLVGLVWMGRIVSELVDPQG
jgi:hypothetical protein